MNFYFVGNFSRGDRYLINEKDLRNLSWDSLFFFDLPFPLDLTLRLWWPKPAKGLREQGSSVEMVSIHRCSGCRPAIPEAKMFVWNFP